MLNRPVVRCYSGHTYPQRPVSFCWEGAEQVVAEVEAAWQEPGKHCFRVRTGGGRRFRLCYDRSCDGWQVTELARS